MTTLFAAVSGSELDRHLRGIARVVRLSGTPEEAEAFDYIEAELRSLSYRVERHASDALIGYPERASLAVLGDGGTTIAANGYSLNTRTNALCRCTPQIAYRSV